MVIQLYGPSGSDVLLYLCLALTYDLQIVVKNAMALERVSALLKVGIFTFNLFCKQKGQSNLL